ncbi:MAG TPA: hypothetical protein VG796_04470 [Verrucomicrobiales bacterium]|nr:hypothetical protein [Verrucomicrobiales bacterium]
MNWHDLLQSAYWQPMAQCGAGAFFLFLLVWWQRRNDSSAWPLVAGGAAWMACHVVVSTFSYQIPPKQPVDWLMPGSIELTLTALLASWKKWPGPVVMVLAGASLLAVTWLALRQMPFLLERKETPVERHFYIAAGIGGVFLTFLGAEWVARKISPAALMAGLAVFAFLTALSLWRMISPQNMVARPLAAAALCAGAALAACLRFRIAVVTPGVAGWLSGGILVFFAFGCLSRAANVPLAPMGAAAAALPAAALFVLIYRVLFSTGHGLAFLAAMLFSGTAVFAWSNRAEEKPAPVPVETGADDTGAYD